MKTPLFPSTRSAFSRRSLLLGGLSFAVASAMMLSSAAACTDSVNGDHVPDQVVGGLFGPSKITVNVPITTVCTPSGCGTLTGGSVHVELWYNGAMKFSGDGIIVSGPGSESQTVPVVVTISPKPNPAITCQVRHWGVAYFSDSGVKNYGPVIGFLTPSAKRSAAAYAKKPVKKS